MLYELLFYNELNIIKAFQAFNGYAKSYSFEIIDSTDPSVQLTDSKPGIKDFFWDLLNEINGFKYQITVKVLLYKYKENRNREFTTVCFNVIAKTVVDFNKYGLDKSFQDVLYRIGLKRIYLDNWINWINIYQHFYLRSIIRKFIHWITS